MKKCWSIFLAVLLMIAATSAWAAAPQKPGQSISLEPGCALCLKGKLVNASITAGQPAELTVSGGTAPYTVTAVSRQGAQPGGVLARPEGGGEWRQIRASQSDSTFRLDGLQAGNYTFNIIDSEGGRISLTLTVKAATDERNLRKH